MTIHDMFPEQKSFIKLQSLLKYRCINSADGFIFPSNHTRKEFERFYPSQLKKIPFSVIHHGLDLEKDEDIVLGIPSKFLLFLGGGAIYKNYEIARQISLNTGIPLVSTGYTEGKSAEDSYTLGSITRKQINYLLKRAEMLLFPSDYEGFGFPIIEAQANGCPVIAAGGGSIPEVLGSDYPLGRFPHNFEGYLHAVTALLDCSHLRQDMISQGIMNSSRFDWNQSKNKHFEFYGELINDFARR